MGKKEFAEILGAINYGNGLKGFLGLSVFLGAGLSLAVLYLGLFVLKSEKVSAASVLAFFAPLVLNYFYCLHLFEQRKKSIEDAVPDMLLLASSIPEGTRQEKMLGFMAMHSPSPLKEEFSAAEKEVEAGMPLEQAFEKIKARNKSASLSRAVDLITNSFILGGKMQSIFRETAEDFMETNALIRERAANAAIEKYTLLFAGGLVVPLILGLVSGMVSGLDFLAASGLGIGAGEEARKKLFDYALLGNIIYIIEYAVIASAFVAFTENQQQKTVVYAFFLVPCGLVVYFLGSGFSL